MAIEADRPIFAPAGVPRLPPSRYCLTVLATLAIACALWLAMALNHFGEHTNASFGLCKLVEAKRVIARRTGSPKILFIAGSSAIRGLDAARVHRATGLNLVNFGLHAGLSAGVMLHEAKKVLAPGDAVVLAFEYTAYTRTGPTTRGIDFIFGCGQGFFEQAPWDVRLMALFGLSPLQLAQPHLQSPRAYFARWGRDEGDFGPRGDLPARAFDQPDPARVRAYGPEAIGIEEGGIGARAITDFVAWAEKHRVQVYATWPNTIRFPAYRNDPGFQDLRNFFGELEVAMIGEPEDAMFPKSLHYNTNYHLNVAGVRLRTDRLISALRESSITEGLNALRPVRRLAEKPVDHQVEPVRERDLRLPVQ